MEQLERAIRDICIEPFVWLFYWCFQPRRFERNFERRSIRERVMPAFKLALPLFLLACPIVLSSRLGVHALLFLPSLEPGRLLLNMLTGILFGIVVGTMGGIGFGLAGGISLGLAGGIGFGLVIGIPDHTLEANILGGIAGGLITGSIMGIAGGKGGKSAVLGIVAGAIAGTTTAMVTDLTLGGDATATILGCTVGMATGIFVSRRGGSPIGRAQHRDRGLIIGAVITAILCWSDRMEAGVLFAICFLLIFYRLPLFPISAFSSWKAYLASRWQPSQVFHHLLRSSLYWDENVYFPLPGLRQMLLIASGQNIERTVKEIAFIVAERPQQIKAARFVALEIAMRDLQMRQTLRDIAGASRRLTEIFPYGTGLIDPGWSTTFMHLHNVSQNAAQVCSPLSWQAKYNALEVMQIDLEQLRPTTAFKDVEMNRLLTDVIAQWNEAVQHELDVLEQDTEWMRRISNPYNPGPALVRQNKLFVGRYELAQQLAASLNERDQPPTLLLHGERRMGKSSLLKHLPDLLSNRYITLFLDIQSPDVTSSVAAFLGIVAEEITNAIKAHGLKVRKLDYERLKDAHRENEAAVYYVFNRWLSAIEKTLEGEKKMLLMFDEFEKLDWAGKQHYLDLELLLNWFRSLTQNHPRLALLFSGVQTFGEMGLNWAGTFANVQIFKVGFLQREEAYRLITQPIENIPFDQVYGEGVVEEIMRVTNCHPFLLQALCSILIDSFNARKQSRIELHDVARGISKLLKNWDSTYFRDVWERSSEQQRTCLAHLVVCRGGNPRDIENWSGQDRPIVLQALETLQDRDLVHQDEQGRYRIAIPILDEWIRHNAGLLANQ